MLTPTVANHFSFFYAVGNTPAINLARSVPHGQDVSALSLGCGDLRNLLYTAYIEDGLPERNLDFTFCDIDEKIIGRNIILLSFIIDGHEGPLKSLWGIYYHLYVDDATAAVVKDQATKLVRLLESITSWNASTYGSVIRFCDQDTVDDVRGICKRISEGNGNLESLSNGIEQSKSLLLQSSGQTGGHGIILTGIRSAAPLSLQAYKTLPEAHQKYWEEGTSVPRQSAEKIPNPMFAPLLSRRGILHYGTDPVQGFHLATAYAALADNSPLNPTATSAKGPKYAVAAQIQFSGWVSALQNLLKRGKLTLRFVVSDVYSFCHTLQSSGKLGTLSANCFRRQWDGRTLKLDERDYGKAKKAPTWFDTIDTSNLSDHFGALNILTATAPLLKDEPWSAVSTELLLKREGTEEEAFDQLLCGPAATISLLLGLSAVQYWTNSKVESHVDEVFLALSTNEKGPGETQHRACIFWKQDGQFSGHPDERGSLQIEAKPLANILLHVYKQMFRGEDSKRATLRSAAYSSFHRGSFAVFLKYLKSRVTTNWSEMLQKLIVDVGNDESLALSSNFLQDFCCQLHTNDVERHQSILINPATIPKLLRIKGWDYIPPVVSVTVIVPRKAFEKLFSGSKQLAIASPTIVAELKSSEWHNLYSDVHILFGDVKSSDPDENSLEIEQDVLGWEGSSPLIASFYIPTASFNAEKGIPVVGLSVLPTGQNPLIYGPVLGPSMSIFETSLKNEKTVLISRYLPGQTAYPGHCVGVSPLGKTIIRKNGETGVRFEANVTDSEPQITSLVGHLDFLGERGKRLLKDKAPIELKQTSPFSISIAFGNNKSDIYPLHFPIPVSKEEAKTRIARTSGYVEIIAPFASPLSSECLGDFVFPSYLSSSRVPAALNMPHTNLDKLPILDVDKKKELSWLTTLTSFQFSTRERHIRHRRAGTGISSDPRTNFKDSLLTMFMLASGLQGGQTGLFTISHPERGGNHILMVVSAIRLDGDTASVVLDAAVIPLTIDLIQSHRIEEFLLVLEGLECCAVTVDDAELQLWKKVLPAFVERCRTWSHTTKCEYKKKGATIPLSIEDGEQLLCSCGNGQLPKNFVNIPEWDIAAAEAVRLAISPTFAAAIVEELADTSTFGEKGGSLAARQERCRLCGKTQHSDGSALKRCQRCKEVKYCSAECQKRDWKTHRMECKESS